MLRLLLLLLTGAACVATAQVFMDGFSRHACALSTTNKIKCWGINSKGALGMGITTSPYGNGPNQLGNDWAYVDTKPGSNVVTITANSDGGDNEFTCVVQSDQNVYCWGQSELLGTGAQGTNGWGYAPEQMGSALSPVVLGSNAQDVNCGYMACCALLTNGQVKCWGNAMTLAIGPPYEPSPRIFPSEYPLGTWGSDRSVMKVSVGYAHSCILFNDGSVQCLGRNSYGELGRGDTINVIQVGTLDEINQVLTPVHQGFEEDPYTGALDVVAKYSYTCILRRDRRIICFGDNRNGIFGLGNRVSYGSSPSNSGVNLMTVDLGTDPDTQEPYLVKSFGFGNSAGCALLMDGSVKCWSPSGNAIGGRATGVTTRSGGTPESMGNNLPFVDFGDYENNNKEAKCEVQAP